MARTDHTRGLRDEANVGPDPRTARELQKLSDLRFEVADGEPDIRGWGVWASTGRELGQVDDLLVDVEAGEVVMIDVDLRRDDRHAYAPLRAAWIDHATRRVVLDTRAVEQALGDEHDLLPGLPRTGQLTDAEVDRYNNGYARSFGDRGVDREHDWRIRRGEDELRFGGRPTHGGAGAAGVTGAAAARPADEPWDGNARVGSGIGPNAGTDPVEREPRRLMDTSGPTALPTPRAPEPHGAHFAESQQVNTELSGLDAQRRVAAQDDARDRRLDRVDDARRLDAAQSIDPRELDARVRLDEGGVIDDRTPVAGVRYEGAHEPHDYGRPDERYGEEYGTGRIGFDRVVSRRPYAGDRPAAEPARDASARVVTPDATRLPADAAHHDPRDARDPRDRDGDGHVSIGERLRDVVADAKDAANRAVRNTSDPDHVAQRVRYRQYDDRYDPGAPGR